MRVPMVIRLACLALAFTCSLASADEPPPRQVAVEPDASTQAEVETRLGSGRFRFCTDENYRLWQEDKDRLCGRLGEIASDCSGLAAACGRPAWDEKVDEPSSPSWLGQLALLLGDYGGDLFRAAFWLILAGGVAYLLVRLVRMLRISGVTEQRVAPSPTHAVPEDVDPEGQPPGVLLDKAAQYIEAGDTRRALHFVYAALLAGLARAGKVRLHKALTTGDYRRSLRRSAGDDSAGNLLWDLDLARFPGAIDGDNAEQLLLRTRQLLGRLSPLVVLLGLLGCSDLRGPEGPFEPTGPRGYALFEELAAGQAESFTRRLRRVTELPDGTTAVVLVAPHLRELEWDTLERYVDDGGHLIAAGRMEGLGQAFGLETADTLCTGPLQVLGLRTFTPDTTATSLHALAPQPADATLATCGSVAFARIHAYGDGQITLIGDESIFYNSSLALGENASLVAALFRAEGGHMEFIGPWTGAGAIHPLESIARSSVGPWLLHLLVVLALLAWARGRRFGTPRALDTSKRRSLLEHARALSGHYRHQGDVSAALARYAAWAVTLLGKRSGSSNRDLRALSLALVQGRGAKHGEAVTAAELHQILLRARAGGELGGDKPKLLRAYRILRATVDDVTSKKVSI